MKNILLHTPEGVRDIYGNELAGKERFFHGDWYNPLQGTVQIL